ncbi:1-deoxy-D-xylulose-5-phosphate synthase [candidate division WOR-3 bacterium]|uniref:1-deoxy-D-xylulose-5-phosphate synthase n=1 Tax=candidate division WOR-3 bacterium TaxID=2052148 RepID=A0A937XFN1_UNCW3|nr:1-deoxy-D-xylulose-5-phosphate synthase [candidate division WOR-3 bacterium]
MALLEGVRSPADVRRMSLSQLQQLAAEIRDLIVKTTAKNGGHTAPSLGVVELTLALHCVYDTPRDQIIWDVGHQCYAHKIITGRRDRFETLRRKGGISGFPKKSESDYDTFDTGHSGDSIGVALGAAVGDRLRGSTRRSVAVIGDGSVAAGMAFEALNSAGCLKQDVVVVLNDNEMSIARSTGAMAGYLNRIITGKMYNRLRADAWNLLGHLPDDLSDKSRVAARKLQEGLKNLVVPSIMFEELGFRYVGPVDGHNLADLLDTFKRVRQLRGPILVHVVTRKGKGYEPAMRHPEVFHGTGPFDVDTGKPLASAGMTFTGAFGEKMVELAGNDERVAAITAGMCLGTGLLPFRDKFPNRLFDVGICEQHAVAFGAGLAMAGMRPVVALYSTFLTRGLDQVIQDVCLQKLPVVFAVDRGGLVGEDGPTHHGVFDLSYLSMVPGLAVMAPMDEAELAAMLEFAVGYVHGPTAIRYPRGGSMSKRATGIAPIELGKAEVLREGEGGCVLAVGFMAGVASRATEILRDRGVTVTLINSRFVKPLDRGLILSLADRHPVIVTVEENVLSGGYGSAVSELIERSGRRTRVTSIGLEDRFYEQGPRDWLLDQAGLSPEKLADRLQQILTSYA